MRWLPRLTGAFALIALIAGGYEYVTDRPQQSPPPFLIDETDFALDGLPPGEHELVVTITNPADVPRGIIGLAEG